jgi:hypothetical protein
MKEFLGKMFSVENRKKSISIICGIVAAIVVMVIVILFATGILGNKNKKVEKQLTARLEELGRNFYEDFYYNQVGKDDEARKEFVKGYSQNGIKINLDNLARSNTTKQESILNEFKNASGEACNSSNTKVAIYPKEPYGVKDYEIKVTLDCGFDKKETTTTKIVDDGNEETDTTTTITTTTTKKKK